jgi:hypothetical protein
VTRITIDERVVPTSALGTPLALNAVEHRVVVEFDTGPPLRRTIALHESANERMSIEPPEATGTPPVAPPPPAIATQPVSPVPSEIPASNTQSEAPPAHGRVLGWSLVGGGVAAAAAGTVVWVLRGNEISTLDNTCTNRVCPASVQPDYDRGKLYDVLGIALFATAGVALAAGGGVLLFGGGKNASTASIRVLPQALPGGAGAVAGGRF